VKIWNKLVTAGQYAFNAAHCVSYSMLAYWCMWLKVHHPAAFYASHLRKFPDEEYRLLRDARKHDISVMPPDLARSEETWNIIGGDILAGFMQMPNIGDKTAKAIMEWRDEQPADRGELGWGDLLEIRGIGQKTVEKMAQFCSNPDPFGITRVERVLDPIRTALRTGELAGLPRPTHRGEDIPTDAKKLRVLYLGIPRMRNPQNVIEDERARTGADMATIRENMKRPDLDKKMAVECYDDTDRTVYLRFPRWTFPKFEEALWDMRIDESVLLIRGEKRGGFGTSVHVDAMWVIEPDD
jgi:DNA polymerase-3 subunit alpha